MPVSLAPPVSRRSLALRPVAGFFDGFEALDTCHRETLRMLGELADLVAQLERTGADSGARRRAAGIDRPFSVTMPQHHEHEERHVFPPLAASGDEATRHAVAC